MKQTLTERHNNRCIARNHKIAALIAAKCIVRESNFIPIPMKHTLIGENERTKKIQTKESDEPARSDITRDQSI